MAKTGVRLPYQRTWFSLLRGAAVGAMLVASCSLQAQIAPTGPELRAAVIVAILRFTSWPLAVPEAENSTVNVCAVGEPPSQPYLLPISGQQKVAGHTLMVQAIDSQQLDSGECAAVVIGAKLSRRDYERVLAQAATPGVLTICDDCRDFVADSTIIQLELFKQRVRFEVNLAKARASGVKLDAQLLELASAVRK